MKEFRRMKAQIGRPAWESDPATEAQIIKLYAMCREAGVFDMRHAGETFEQYEMDVVLWVNRHKPEIRSLNELTKGDMQLLYAHLE